MSDAFFDLMNKGRDRAYCFEWAGAWIDCWIEVEIDGKKTLLGEGLGENVRIEVRHLAGKEPAGGEPSGQLVWLRREENEREVWELFLGAPVNDGKAVAFQRYSPPTPAAGRLPPGEPSGVLPNGQPDSATRLF